MFKWLVTFTTFTCVSIISALSAGCTPSTCCQSFDVEVGWRRDSLDWKLHHLDSSHGSAHVKDTINFKGIDFYTISGQFKWVSSDYYIRLSGDYGFSVNGRAHEHFHIESPYLYSSVGAHTSNHIKRNSEAYDFDAAIGYPFAFFCCRLSVIPLIGFSYHRQRLLVKEHHEHSSSSSSYDDYPESSSEFFHSHSSSSFFVKSSNPFRSTPSSNPFSGSSDDSENIANELGLSNPHRTDHYRFTWYGVYLGADIAFALDNCWTLFWDTEFHFLNDCSRKRKSWTGVYFVDDYHKRGSAYGFNNVVGLTYYIANNWYTTLSVDFDWWKSDAKHDELRWKKVGAKIGFAYAF